MKKEVLSIQLLWIGIVVLAGGITLRFLGATYVVWSLLGILLGTVLILIYVFFNFSAVQEFLVSYSTRQWAIMSVFILLLIAVMIVVQMIANNHNYRFDLTSDKKMTLAPMTEKLLRESAAPVKVIGFYQENERDDMQTMMDMYSLASKRFSYELYNLDRNPGLAQRYGITSYGNAVVETADRWLKVNYPTEDALINAILRLTSTERKVIYFLSGHGERSLEGLEEDTISYGLAKQALVNENFDVRVLVFAGGKAIPSDADVVVCGGPAKDFTESDIAMLDQYVAGGGCLIVLQDPGNLERMQAFLNTYGIAPGNDIVVDPEDYLIEKNPLVPLAPFYFSHSITEDFTVPTVFPLVRSVDRSHSAPSDLVVRTLVRSGERSWGETDVDQAEKGTYEYDPRSDRKGPVSLAAVSEPAPEKTRNQAGMRKTPKTGSAAESGTASSRKGKLVVFGDSDFLLNEYFSLLGNRDLFLNTVHWMTEEDLPIAVRSKTSSPEDNLPVYLSPVQARLIFIGIVILQPVAVLAIGGVVAWRRRFKG
ncbi:MAG TPA: Gldg family protein [Thermodesulfobacteriota bacterium]|nr:GldG family protein [Deltaproteobacteria bacterium]HNR12833.1 Gldg family protein [Thermodesulfobacteriota bacterium]HNU72957.1 Gldg family protein [Thermodesulfobacteriota bacterium]